MICIPSESKNENMILFGSAFLYYTPLIHSVSFLVVEVHFILSKELFTFKTSKQNMEVNFAQFLHSDN